MPCVAAETNVAEDSKVQWRAQALDQTDLNSNLEFAALSNFFVLIDPKFPELSKWG